VFNPPQHVAVAAADIDQPNSSLGTLELRNALQPPNGMAVGKRETVDDRQISQAAAQFLVTAGAVH